MKGPKHIPRRDEEPDVDDDHRVRHDVWLDAISGLCAFCGQEGHRKDLCPNRPVTKGRER